ncbi:pyridoxamine 5'-phosphate oxidase family protein [bacterium]|nr:pyridoxamine 5'-phosphate oxidase family protein [bacterium]
MMNQNFTKFAFTDSVKRAQERYGSRKSYARMETSGDQYVLTSREIPFIQSRDSFYMATVGENGWPYVQFRGGPKGFLKVLDNITLGYADFRGNMQYISVGNIDSSRKASLFFMDYPSQKRLKIWAESEVLDAERNTELLEKLKMSGYKADIERLIIFRIQAFDWNCPQHITPRYTSEEIAGEVAKLNPDILKSCCPDDIK